MSLAWLSQCLMFIHVLCWFSNHVQFTTRVIFGFAILLSNHVYLQPRRDFRVDKISWFSSLALSSLLESTHYLTALHQSLAEMFQSGRCHLPAAPKIPALRCRSLCPLCSQDSRISTYAFWHDCCRLAVFSIDYRPYLRATHCPVRVIVGSQHRHHPHHRLSIFLRATYPSEPCLVDHHHRHPPRYLRWLFSLDSTERRIILRLRVRHRVLSASSRWYYVHLNTKIIKVVYPICSLKMWDWIKITVCRSKYHVGTLLKN